MSIGIYHRNDGEGEETTRQLALLQSAGLPRPDYVVCGGSRFAVAEVIWIVDDATKEVDVVVRVKDPAPDEENRVAGEPGG